MSPAPWLLTRPAGACWRCSPTAPPRCPAPARTAWTRLTTRQALATSPAGTRCEPGSLNAAAFSPSGQPMLAAGCGRPGTAGIFSDTGRTWQLTGPALPAAYAHQAITVLRLHYHRRHHHGAAGCRNRVSGTPAGRLVCRWRRALETVAAAAAERRHADIGVVRAWQQPGDHPEPPPRGGYQQRRRLRGGRCRCCPRALRRSHRAPQADGTPWPSTARSSPSGRRRPAPDPGPASRSSRFPSNSAHQADRISVTEPSSAPDNEEWQKMASAALVRDLASLSPR